MKVPEPRLYSYLVRPTLNGEHVCTVAEFGFLSFIAPSPVAALLGAIDLVHHVLLDLESSGEEIPTPLGAP